MCWLLHAEAESAFLQGQGIARQRQAIVNGLRESVLNFESGLENAVSPQEVIELMMVRSSLWSQSSFPACAIQCDVVSRGPTWL